MAKVSNKTKQTNKGKSTQSNKSNNNSGGGSGSIKDEIIILCLLALSILMLISNFGFGGFIGELIAKFIFGMFGWLGYLFPICLFIGVTFFYINREKIRIYFKLVSWILIWIAVCTISELAISFDATAKIGSYYQFSSEHRIGGGLLGGLFAKFLSPSIGVAGTVIVLMVIIIISGVVISEKSFLKGVTKVSVKAHEDVARRTEQASKERSLKKEAKLREKQKYEPVTGVSFDTTLKKGDEIDELGIKAPFESGTIRKGKSKPLPDLFKEEPACVSPISSTVPETSQHEEQKPVEEIREVHERKQRRTKESKRELEEETEVISMDIKRKNDSEGTYVFPPIDLLSKGQTSGNSGQGELRDTAIKLQQTLHSFGVNVQVTNFSKGPSVTRYELQPEKGVKVSRIVGLADD
ncbi:MAG: DNA translocase FtsK 4TM domain-containing protein, partial [Eubacteriales bacterium]